MEGVVGVRKKDMILSLCLENTLAASYTKDTAFPDLPWGPFLVHVFQFISANETWACELWIDEHGVHERSPNDTTSFSVINNDNHILNLLKDTRILH